MKLELDLENDSSYRKATKKLEENLAKVSPLKNLSQTTSRSIGKFEYKTPKAASLLAGLNETLKKPIDLNMTPVNDGDDAFENKTNRPSSSTPLSAINVPVRSNTIISGVEQQNIKTQDKAPLAGSSNFIFRPKLRAALRDACDESPDTTSKLFTANKKSQEDSTAFPKEIAPLPMKAKDEKKLLSTSNSSGNLDRILSPAKQKPSVRFDPELNECIVEVLNSPRFTKKGLSKTEIESQCQYLKETNHLLLGKFFDIISQIPVEFFGSIPKFEMATYSKLKSLIENVRGKIKVNEKALDNFNDLKKPSIGSRKSRIEPFNDSVLNDTDKTPLVLNASTMRVSNKHPVRDFENDLAGISTPTTNISDSQKKSSGFVFKKPLAGTLHSLNDSKTDEKIVETQNPVNEDEDDDDIESIMDSIREAELIDKGRSNQRNLSSIDLVTPPGSFRRTEPRITFNANETSLRNTQFIENVETQVDDDGWQVYDPSQFEDNNPRVSNDFVSVSDFQRKEPNRDAELCRLLDDVDNQAPIGSSSSNTQNSLGNFHSGVRNDGLSGEFDGMNYPHSEQLKVVFREIFGLRSFRPNQLQVINATLLGNDCFVLMPTGGGKSLCYQLPALLTEGVTVVVSPLKSLILDQVNKLNSLDISAAHLSGEVSYADQQKIYVDLERPKPVLKLLYVTPEKICSSGRFQNILSGLYRMKQLARFVIDEAHCVSAWGHDFRPDYKKLSVLREQFPTIPTIALTATANLRVRTDVVKQLRLQPNTRWFLCSFNRPNLKYIIRPKQGVATKAEIIDLIKGKFPRASGIVYCLSKKDCDQLAGDLKGAGIKAKSYHAGLSDSQRESTQKDWITDKIKVVCATIAFGMGIDKPDVRYVIHHSMPKSIEGYYQEAGRAGRDGELATCILFYNYSDMLRYRKMMDRDGGSISYEAKQVHIHNLFRMVNYCENVADCRRSQQLNYFAEHFTREQCLTNRASACDNCLMQGEYKTVDVTDDCLAIAKCVRDLCCGRNRFTLLHLVDVFKGSEQKKILDNNHHRTPYHGRLKSWEKNDIQRLMHKLVIEDYLKEDLIFANDIPQAYLKIGTKIEKLMSREVRINFSIKEKTSGKRVQQIDLEGEPRLDTQSNAQLKELQERCYNDLLDICRTLAAEKNVTLASVMNMQALKAMSERLPETQAEMLALPHVTKANFEKYGQQLLEITQNYAAEKLCLMLDAEAGGNKAANDSASDASDDQTDWNRLAREAGTSGTAGSGKRRKSWGSGGRGAKRFRRGAKSKTRARTKSAVGRGGTTAKRDSTRGGGSSRGSRSRTSGFGLLPLPDNR
ncbi:recQ-like DNA helicase Blm isoform X2 [Toxorhynchites rutilus septentrionalis]|nr:recQ-like DNA helicase Blm isoform X2 [Toxorhynchites rutilus septentrionalis]